MPSRPSHNRAAVPSRPHPFRLQKKALLIYCEGSETEYNYLEGLRKECHADLPYRIIPKPGPGKNALTVVTAAKDEGKRTVNRTPVYDEVCCVLDVETEERRENLTEAIALARRHKITLYLSNPSFEVWLLCHFGHVTKWLENGTAAKQYLSDPHWQRRFNRPYTEGDPEVYTGLAKDLPAAIDNARYILEKHDGIRSCRAVNPSTNVYQLVERLLVSQTNPAPPAP